jgi:hypothetical protein
MDAGEEELYEFIDFSLLERLKSYIEWAPLVNQVRAIGMARTAHERSVAVVKTLQWFATGSATTIDDEALAHIEAVLKTPEGKAFLEWGVRRFLNQ